MASDITIICPNGRQLLCHRAVLASRSKRLAAVFASGEYTGQHLPVSGVDSAALEAVVSSFYTGECPVSLDTVVAVHDAASKLEVPDLLQSCLNYVQQAMCMDNASTLLGTAQQLKDVQIIEVCRQYIHSRFAELASSHDFHKQSFEVATSILLDANNSGTAPLLNVLHVAASWLSRQPGRDALKMPLLQSMNAPAGSAAMFDDIMARMSMMHAGPVTSTPTLALGANHGMDHMGGTPGGRISVGNLVMPTNMNSRDSMNGARLLPGPGMSMASLGTLGMAGGLESPLGALPPGMMSMSGNSMGQTLINNMQQQHGMQQQQHGGMGQGGHMYPGMQQLIISTADGQQMYHMATDNHQMFAHQLLAQQVNQHPDHHQQQQQHVIHINGNPVVVSGNANMQHVGMQQASAQLPQGNSPANAAGRRQSNGKMQAGAAATGSPAGGRKAGGGSAGKRRGSGAGRKAATGAGVLGLSADAQVSEDDHSEATRSMPTNEHSDGERTSSGAAQGGAAAAAGGAAGAGGAPPPRQSWFGMDGVLALAEAAEAAEQKAGGKGGAKPKADGASTPAGAEGEQPAASGNSAKRRAPGEEGGDAEATPDGAKRLRTSAGGLQDGGQQQQGGMGPLLNNLQVQHATNVLGMHNDGNNNGQQQVLTSTGQLFTTGGFNTGSQLPSIPNLSNLPNHLGGGNNAGTATIAWDTLTAHNLGGLNGAYGGSLDGGNGGNVLHGGFLQSLQSLQGMTGAGGLMSVSDTFSGLNSANAQVLQNILDGAQALKKENSRQEEQHKALQHLVRQSGAKMEATASGGNGGGGGGGGRGKSSSRSSQQPVKGFCHVDNCNADLTGLRDYHQRYKICDFHLKAPSIMRDGVPQRFCQQCGRFHLLDAFDGTRRSCRAMLQRHNARRNKRNPDALPLPAPDGPRGMYLQSVQAMQNLQNLTNGGGGNGGGGAAGGGAADVMAAAGAMLHGSSMQQLLGEGGASGDAGAGGGGAGQSMDGTGAMSLMMGLTQGL